MRTKRFIASVFFFSLAYQLVFPVATYALTSGPSQPEMQSFEPVGTTDMVNMFSGDFNYNIPLLDIEGYPVNIAYHAGASVEQESSWVGLGWNINPGNINHVVRGISDDFNGEEIKKDLVIEDENSKYFNIFFGVEAAGFNLEKLFSKAKSALKEAKISAGGQLNFGMNFSNYNGVSASIGVNASAQTRGGNSEQAPWISTGINMGATVSTDKGIDVDYSLTLSSPVGKQTTSELTGNVGASVGGGMNSREGMKYSFWGVNASVNSTEQIREKHIPNGLSGSISNTYIPTGLQNYVPVITNATKMQSLFFQLKVGGELWSMYPFAGGGYGENTTKVDPDGTKKAYGYFNVANASGNDILDFSREKDGQVNKKTAFLPIPSMNYDIYSVNGQGTGGNFRPYRNDIGTVHDPILGSNTSNDSHLAEAGIGNLFEGGYDMKTARTDAHSGPWHIKKFTKKEKNSLYEPYYMKQAGELTEKNNAHYAKIGETNPLTYNEALALDNTYNTTAKEERVGRSNLLYFLTAEEAARNQISLLPELENYGTADPNRPNGFKNQADWTPSAIHRVEGDIRKAHQVSEFTQVLPDGQRYIFGLPVMNLYQKDYEVGVAAATSSDVFDASHYITGIGCGTVEGIDNMPTPTSENDFSSRTITPSYAHSYMLTSVLSPDYVDITGNGITEDDLGSFTKFNYSKKENYIWRVPYGANTAQVNRGLRSNCKDDHATFSAGEREQWVLHSIESRNFVAEFYTSTKNDAKSAGAETNVFVGASSSKSYKLDSIVLYNKWDRFENTTAATPIQTVVFSYDYSLCPQTPNSESTSQGKLTLKSIFIKKGQSSIGYLSPYQFKYNEANKPYNVAAKDCWGNFKPYNGNNIPTNQNIKLNNLDYPYVNQNDPNLDEYSATWNLEEIIVPSGGKIKVSYEADDYGYVQNKKAMEMFRVEGVGPSKLYTPNNTLYSTAQNPYLYVYFKRKTSDEHGADIASSYLDGDDLIQFTFDVLLSAGELQSCTNMPITEAVKGYAKVVGSGVCDNSDYGYIQLEPKTPNTIPALASLNIAGAKLNPISLAAINMARLNHPKALYPEGDIPSGTGKALINAFKASLGDVVNFYQNPLKTYMDKSKAKSFTIGKSYIRLVSQGLKKKGGGHRVKRIEFVDEWNSGTSPSETTKYGSQYDYTTVLPGTSMKMSSGVASYEPLFGGDENPCRRLLNVNEIGNDSKFPPVDPIELLHEGPLGETLYPGASVGYSKVTVTSIHKDEGESSQTIQEYEHYTAKDFPVKMAKYTPVQVIENRKPKAFDLFNKQEIYRVAQGYSLEMNDMHGKLKQVTTAVAKYNPNDLGANPDSREVVAYTRYNYFSDGDGIVNDNIPCLSFDIVNPTEAPIIKGKTVGEEVEVTLDSRKKEEKTSFKDFHFSTNTFLAPPLPIVIPIGFPKFKKQSKTFSSFVTAKVVQKYGIIKSVESYNKGALVKAENYAFDEKTGQPLITTVNTEYGDKEYSIKYPAYWAYRCMGAAYENIQFEEELPQFDAKGNVGSKIRDNIAYLRVNDIEKYNIGDEIELNLEDLCENAGAAEGRTYKLWIVDKGDIKPVNYSCSTQSSACAGSGLSYRGTLENRAPASQKWTGNACVTPAQLNAIIAELTNESEILDLTNATIGHCQVRYNTNQAEFPLYIHRENYSSCTSPLVDDLDYLGIFFHAPNASHPVGLTPSNNLPPTNYHFNYVYDAVIGSSYTGPIPNESRYKTRIQLIISYNLQKKISSGGSFIDIPPLRKVAPLYSNTYVSIGEIDMEVWTDQKPILGSNPCAYFFNSSTPFQSYVPDQTKSPANNSACSSEYLQLRGGVLTKGSQCNVSDQWADKNYLIAKPYKKYASDVALSSNSAFPENDNILKGSVKVLRSGKRNMLNETIQNVTLVADSAATPSEYVVSTAIKLKGSSARVINASAKTFTDIAKYPYGINGDYFNPFITGEKGNFRTESTYTPTTKRSYPDGSGNKESDRYKGTYPNIFLWAFGAPGWDKSYRPEYQNKMAVQSTLSDWRKISTNIYSVWGLPVNVKDALSHENSILYDFNNRVPAAVATNIEENLAIFESFEDTKELHKYETNPIRSASNPLKYNANPLKQWLLLETAPASSPDAVILSDGTRHSGKNALKFIQNTDITFTVGGFLYGINVLNPFFVFNSKKYIVSWWQKVSTNGSAPPITAGMQVKWGPSQITDVAKIKAKTPPIDGWVLYEGEFSVSSAASLLTISATANTIIDDFRLFPASGNMKGFVYDNLHRRISATLDENHMATFFEYDAQGKLVRVKKETEKGILTIKESRESLKELISDFTY